MAIERLNPPAVHAPAGYTHAVKAGDTVYVSGQVALAPDGSLVGPDDAAAQAEQVYRNLEAVLAAVGASFRDVVVVKVTTFLTRPEDIPALRDARERHLSEAPPASSMVVVSRLARPDLLVEIEEPPPVATPGPRRHLHRLSDRQSVPSTSREVAGG
jgi:enamine deaminase RidA (YjgF/YER057c/UK114 family)